jgi:hypothetical protein
MIRFCGAESRRASNASSSKKPVNVAHQPCIILDGVSATGEYQGFNPENDYIFWREVRLERVAPSDTLPAVGGGDWTNDQLIPDLMSRP